MRRSPPGTTRVVFGTFLLLAAIFAFIIYIMASSKGPGSSVICAGQQMQPGDSCFMHDSSGAWTLSYEEMQQRQLEAYQGASTPLAISIFSAIGGLISLIWGFNVGKAYKASPASQLPFPLSQPQILPSSLSPTLLAPEPQHLALLRKQGQENVKQNNYEEALKAFSSLTQQCPNNALYHYNTAQVLEKLGRRDEALAAYDKCIRLEPDDSSAYFAKAFLLLNMGKTTRGEITMGKASRRTAILATLNNYRKGENLFQEGRYEEALSEYKNASYSNPTITLLAYEGQAKTLKAMGQLAEAEQAEQKIQELRQKA